MFISPFVQYPPAYVYNFMTILFQLKPDRRRDSQMNTKQQATFDDLCGNSVYISVCWSLLQYFKRNFYKKKQLTIH